MKALEEFLIACTLVALIVGGFNVLFPETVRSFVESERQRIEGSITNAKSD